jgi:predicted TIM-barrel fold metal-dependent hydrolase
VTYHSAGFLTPALSIVQFHTGLGDADITLMRANPAHLQPLIAKYPRAKFVLLHASYPYTREASYLTAVYKNVYLDIGEVFPLVSKRGQEALIRQALELVPTNKLMWSSEFLLIFLTVMQSSCVIHR